MAGVRLTLLLAIATCYLLQVSRGQGATIVSVSITITPVAPTPTPSPSPAVTSTSTVIPTTTVVSPSPTTTSSSSSSSSSPTPTPTPTPSPTRTPSPSVDFVLNRTNGGACAHVATNFVVEFTYINGSDSRNKTITAELKSANLQIGLNLNKSSCGNSSIVFAVWFNNHTDYNHTLTFYFTEKNKKKYELESVAVELDLEDQSLFCDYNTSIYGDTITGKTEDDDGLYTSNQDKSYKCKSTRKFTLVIPKDLEKDGEKLVLKLYDFQAQAFSFKNETTGAFDRSWRCSQDQKTSKVVPIAVGAALAGLVVVVLVAYLIGRFRSRKQNNYEALS